jgi:hypothetical protein
VRVYASVDDLEDEISSGPTPPNPDRLLALASTAVDNLLTGCVYTVDDTTGLPTDPDDVERLKRLTVLQALWMAGDPDGVKDAYTKMTTSTVSVERPGGRPRFAPRAVEYLQAAGYPGSGLVIAR